MFDQLKDLYKLRKQAAEMEKQLASERISARSANGLVSIIINGKHELVEVLIDEREKYDRNDLAISFKEAHNMASAKLQSILAQKFQGML